MGLLSDIIVPCIPVLARLEERGMPLDLACRDRFRQETLQRLDHARTRTLEIVVEYHAKRVELIRRAIGDLEAKIETAKEMALPHCQDHADYLGLTKRAKCPGCFETFNLNTGVREVLKDLKGRVSKGRVKLAQVGEVFQVDNDNHWRWLLFEKEGLGLRPVAWTDKKKIPQVGDDAIDKLQRRHPDVELLRLRVEAKKGYSRLVRALGMGCRDDGTWFSKLDPDEKGRVHFAYSMHRSGFGRLASGEDDDEDDKLRESEAGNAQNITDRDRRMYVAEPGMILLSGDWSQIEARIFAWLARDLGLLDAWRRGLDIHAVNAHVLAKAIGFDLPEGKEDEIIFPYDPGKHSFRHCGKLTHKLHYGLQAKKFSDTYGIEIMVCQRIIDEYFREHHRLRAFQLEEYERALKDRKLVNCFGRVMRFWNFEMKQGVLVLNEREEALASRSQSTVGDMCKAALPEIEQVADNLCGELLTTTHDSYLLMLPNEQGRIEAGLRRMRDVMEREWPQLGEIEGFGAFRCPADFAVGANWGKWHEAENPNGLRKFKLAA